ncbi:ATP-dependent nuclease [Rhodovibrio salinarum]|uniref:ATP-dependent endonuclease of the OLD family n=1 Tax=Rhodovibrio salinarum TaxID=1087 RepID=A0A934QGC2_9PROT|nr:AAA family ATPase [Rhodovibrio salinarum]MBK1695985.1 hypothetical protein [Rhodovibrio salinarum]
MSGHIISRIVIENFRSFQKEEIALSAFTPLVGKNNAGKSNLLAAIRWLISKSVLSKSEYNKADIPIIVEGTVSGVSDDIIERLDQVHARKIKPFVHEQTVTLRREQKVDASSAKDITLSLFDPTAGTWKENPSGIDNAIKALFPEPIVIGAMENAADDVAKFGKSSSIGRLLTEIIEPIREVHAKSIRDALESVEKSFSANSAEKDDALIALDERLQKEVANFFPGIVPKTHIPVPGLDDFLKSATIKIFEDGYPNERDAAEMGHGAQRSIQMGLVTCLSEVRREKEEKNPTTTMLMLDEPELYLHPQAVELVRSALSSLSQRGYQVLFSTHSADMIDRSDAENVVLVRKSDERGTHVRRSLREAVTTAIADAPSQSEMLFSLTNSSKILFTERVLLVEGSTELRVFPHVFRKCKGKTLAEFGVGLVEIDGSGSLQKAKAVLEAMDIPTVALVDLDYAFKEPPSDREKRYDDAVNGCRKVFVDLEAAGELELGDDGYPKKSTICSASRGFEKLAESPDAQPHIEVMRDVLKSVQLWLWSMGTIETHLGLEGKKPAHHAAFLKRLDKERDLAFISDEDGVREFCDWLLR